MFIANSTVLNYLTTEVLQHLTSAVAKCVLFSASTKIIATAGYSGIYPDIVINRKSELIDINDECTTALPDYPLGVIGATGVYVDGKIVICGGAYHPVPQMSQK